MRRSLTATTLAGLAIFGTAAIAAAQDVEVRIRISPEVGRQISRIVQREILPEIQQDLRGALRDLTPVISELTPMLSDLAALARSGLAGLQDRDFRAEQTKRETKTLSLGASGALDLENLGGDIMVTAGSGRDVIVEIVRTSRARTDADAQLGLERIVVDVEQHGNRATIKTRYNEQGRRQFRVNTAYNVTAPAGTAINIKSLGGNLRVKGIHGDLTATTAGGNIEVAGASRISQAKTLGGNITLTDVNSDGTLVAETFGGNVTLQGVKARRITASTTGGDVIARDVDAESAELSSLGGSVEFGGALSRNGRYDLHSTGGNIRLFPTGPVGFELDASTFAGEIRSDLSLKMVGPIVAPRGPRRTVHGTFGDGSAVIKATTMSGNVYVGKK